MKMPIRILIVEDDEHTRSLIRKYLARDPTLKIVAETPDGKEALILAEQHHPDIVLMDLSIKGIDGLKATRLIKKSCPSADVVIMTNYPFEELKERARESPQWVQSSAFLDKLQISTQLLSTIKSLTEHRRRQAESG